MSLWHGALKAWPQQVRFGYRNGDEMGQHTVRRAMEECIEMDGWLGGWVGGEEGEGGGIGGQVHG